MAWKAKQKGIVKMYQRYAGMPDQVYRAKLREYTGATSSTDTHLCQFHFDTFMAALEIAAHLAETNGMTVGKRPPKLTNWYYWRRRCPSRGMVNSRQLHKISQLWDTLTPLLPSGQGANGQGADPPYLLEIACHAVGHFVEALCELRTAEANSLIEALKDRLSHALKRTGAA